MRDAASQGGVKVVGHTYHAPPAPRAQSGRLFGHPPSSPGAVGVGAVPRPLGAAPFAPPPPPGGLSPRRQLPATSQLYGESHTIDWAPPCRWTVREPRIWKSTLIARGNREPAVGGGGGRTVPVGNGASQHCLRGRTLTRCVGVCLARTPSAVEVRRATSILRLPMQMQLLSAPQMQVLIASQGMLLCPYYECRIEMGFRLGEGK